MKFADIILCCFLLSRASYVFAGIKKDNCNCGCNCENRVKVKFAKPPTRSLPEPTPIPTCPDGYTTVIYGDGMESCYKQHTVPVQSSQSTLGSYEQFTLKCSEDGVGAYLATFETNEEFFAFREWYLSSDLPSSASVPGEESLTYGVLGGHRTTVGGTWTGGPNDEPYPNLLNLPLDNYDDEDNCFIWIHLVSEGEITFEIGTEFCNTMAEALQIYPIMAICEADQQ